MRYVKSCKRKHNLALGHKDIRLGTFQEFREGDPKFAVTDANEGLTQLNIHANDLTLTMEQWNEAIGRSGAFSIGSKMRSYLAHTVQYDDRGMTFVMNSDGTIKIDGTPSLRVSCPNVYMFCLSGREVPPESIDPSYDSQFFIEQEKVADFAGRVASCLLGQFSADQIDHPDAKEVFDAPISCSPEWRDVTYVSDQTLTLNEPGQFKQNTLVEKIKSGMFEKTEDYYAKDGEFRILFPIIHPEAGLVPVTKDAAIVEINDAIRALLFS